MSVPCFAARAPAQERLQQRDSLAGALLAGVADG